MTRHAMLSSRHGVPCLLRPCHSTHRCACEAVMRRSRAARQHNARARYLRGSVPVIGASPGSWDQAFRPLSAGPGARRAGPGVPRGLALLAPGPALLAPGLAPLAPGRAEFSARDGHGGCKAAAKRICLPQWCTLGQTAEPASSHELMRAGFVAVYV